MRMANNHHCCSLTALSSRRRTFFRIAALCFIPAILVVAEIALQIRFARRHIARGTAVYSEPDEYLGYRLRRGFRSPDGSISVNQDGIRGGANHLASSPGEPRILVVGNSCVFGVGVGDTEVFTHVLENLLRAAGEESAIVFNAGVGGYNSNQCAVYLERELGRFRPTHLILYLGWNDLVTATWTEYLPNHQLGPAFYPPPTGIVPLLARSRLFWSLRSRWRGWSLEHLRADRGRDVWNEAWIENFSVNLDRMTRWAEERGIPVFLCRLPYDPGRYIPYYSFDSFKYSAEGYHRLWLRFQEEIEAAAARSAGARVIDLPDAIRGREHELEIIFDYNHLGPEGHRLVAERMLTALAGTISSFER